MSSLRESRPLNVISLLLYISHFGKCRLHSCMTRKRSSDDDGEVLDVKMAVFDVQNDQYVNDERISVMLKRVGEHTREILTMVVDKVR